MTFLWLDRVHAWFQFLDDTAAIRPKKVTGTLGPLSIEAAMAWEFLKQEINAGSLLRPPAFLTLNTNQIICWRR